MQSEANGLYERGHLSVFRCGAGLAAHDRRACPTRRAPQTRAARCLRRRAAARRDRACSRRAAAACT